MSDDGADARRVAPVEPLRQLIAEMHTMSDGIDNANNHTDYQVRLIALGLTAREFLRRHRALEAQRIAAPPEGTLEHLASAMRKVLPPELLAEVLAHLDQLTPFLKELRAAAGVHPPQETT